MSGLASSCDVQGGSGDVDDHVRTTRAPAASTSGSAGVGPMKAIPIPVTTAVEPSAGSGTSHTPSTSPATAALPARVTQVPVGLPMSKPSVAAGETVTSESAPLLSSGAPPRRRSSAFAGSINGSGGGAGRALSMAGQPLSHLLQHRRNHIPCATADDLQQLRTASLMESRHSMVLSRGIGALQHTRQEQQRYDRQRRLRRRDGGGSGENLYRPTLGGAAPRTRPSLALADSSHQQHPRRRALSNRSSGVGLGEPQPAEEGEDDVGPAMRRDSFGNPAYRRIFPGDPFDSGTGGGAAGKPEIDVPWELRETVTASTTCAPLSFLSTRYFWFLIEWSLRLTCIGILLPAALINAHLPRSPFFSSTFALSSAIIATGTSFGQSGVFFVQFMKAGCIWLPLATACNALRLNRSLAVWFVVYTAVLFLIATFTERTTRRLCLLLYNISMVSLLSGNAALDYPSKVLLDWFLGAAFALAGTVIPYPMLATRASAKISRQIFSCTATCFTGILFCFWAPSNTERSMSMVRIRYLVRSIDQLIDKFDAYDVFTFYEVLFFERYEQREVRKKKVELLLKLKMNLRAMERVINMVQEKPHVLDQSDRCLLFNQYLSQPMEGISRSVEAVLASLSSANMYADLRQLGPYFEACGRAVKELQDAFSMARRMLFYESEELPRDATAGAPASVTVPSLRPTSSSERMNANASSPPVRGSRGDVDVLFAQTLSPRHVDGVRGSVALPADSERMEEFVPLMTFFVFSIVNFWSSLSEFQTFINTHEPIHDWQQSFHLVLSALLDPFVENVILVRNLFTRRGEAEVRVVIEAAKVSVAMLISVIFFYYLQAEALLLSGPTIIAFVSGTNPVEAVQASAARLSGTLFGSVVGFFASSLCRNAVDRVAAMCVITFTMTFFRTDKKVGTICMYCNFVAVATLGPPDSSAESTISRIQQNTFSIFIYCFISVVVFPVSPNRALFEARLQVVRNVSATLTKLVGLMRDASVCYEGGSGGHTRAPRRGTGGGGGGGGGGLLGNDGFGFTSGNDGDGFDDGGMMGGLDCLRGFDLRSLQDGGRAELPFTPTGTGTGQGIVTVREIDTRNGRGEASADGRPFAGMPTAFIMAPEDTTIQGIFAEIMGTLDLMKTATSIMPLASEEFYVIPREYPLRATGDVQAALYRLCALVYTMACSWKAMREKGYFTMDVIHIFHNLAPLAIDIALCMERFANILVFYVHHPSSGLSSELTRTVVQLRILCAELSARKERNLLAIIRKTRAERGLCSHRPHHRGHPRGGSGGRRRPSEDSDSSLSGVGPRRRGDDAAHDGGRRAQAGARARLAGESAAAPYSPTSAHGEVRIEVVSEPDTARSLHSSSSSSSSHRDTAMAGVAPVLGHNTAPFMGEVMANETRIFNQDREAMDALTADRRGAPGSRASSSSKGEGLPMQTDARPCPAKVHGQVAGTDGGLRESHGPLSPQAMEHPRELAPGSDHHAWVGEGSAAGGARLEAAAGDSPDGRGQLCGRSTSLDDDREVRVGQYGARDGHHRDPQRQEQEEGEDSQGDGMGGTMLVEMESRARYADDSPHLPYGSRERDRSPMTEAKVLDRTGGDGGAGKPLRGGRGKGQQTPGRARESEGGSNRTAPSVDEADRFTLDPSDPSSRESSSTSPDPSDSTPASAGFNDSLNESFTAPVTALDAEGLHAFTLSLEMLTRELRKVLFGLEEMLQSH